MTSWLRIEGTTICSPTALGFSFGNGMGFATARERVSSNFGSSSSLCQQLLNRNPFKQTSLVVGSPDRTEADAQGWGYFNS
jgi:hypothetical protein